uniref:Uncharacterized protein n=1 Tax=Graphocephala atropunctata TaxID=36148 RepID=A0A1B6KLH7_9HEMI
MLLIIHTLTVTVADVEISAKFFHVMCPSSRRVQQGFVAKRIGVAWSRNKSQCGRSKYRVNQPHLRQNLQAMIIGALQSGNGKPIADDQLQVHHMIKSSLAPQASLPDVPNSTERSLASQGAQIASATPQQTMTWLQANRFAAYLHTFASFSGSDLMRLSRDDLIQICGLADGIRLFNALHPRAKTLYLCVQNSPVVYQAVYLASLSSREMCDKVAALLGFSLNQLTHVYMQGPNGIHVVITDELVRNIKDEATFITELISDQSGEGLCLVLKPPPSH